MTSCADIIYGIPITREMDRWLQEHMDDEDVQCEEFEQLGFWVQYSGNADHQCGWLGAGLCGMNAVNPVQLLTDSVGNITGVRGSQDTSLKPTPEQVGETIAAYNKLPDGLRAVSPPIGIHIVWSTS
jgi:hypothetical protein